METTVFVNIHQILAKLYLPLLDTKKVITISIKYEFKNCYKKVHCSCKLGSYISGSRCLYNAANSEYGSVGAETT